MARSNRPAQEQLNVVAKTRTETEEDFITYGLEMHLDLAKNDGK